MPLVQLLARGVFGKREEDIVEGLQLVDGQAGPSLADPQGQSMSRMELQLSLLRLKILTKHTRLVGLHVRRRLVCFLGSPLCLTMVLWLSLVR